MSDDGIQKGGSSEELLRRVNRVLSKEAPKGLVVVFDEQGMMDFGHNITLVEAQNAAIEYACDLARYPGDE